ncbi:MAG: TolC family protein [Gemmatimonas sp.]
MKFIYHALIAGVLLNSVSADAAVAQQPGRTAEDRDTVAISIDEAVSRALSRSQEARLARLRVDLAATEVKKARADALPSITGTLDYTRTYATPFNTGGGGFVLPDSLKWMPDSMATIEDRLRYIEKNATNAGLGGLGSLFGNLPLGQVNGYVARLSGTQTLYSGGKVGAALRIAKDYQESVRLDVREQLADLELNVRTAYYKAVLAFELAEISRVAMQQAADFLTQTRLRREAGTASELDLLRADVELENLRPQSVQALNGFAIAELELKRLLDIPPTASLRFTTALETPADTTGIAQVNVDQRATVRAAERQVAIKQSQVKIAKGDYQPQVTMRLNFGSQAFPARTFDLATDQWRPDISASLGVSLPIFTGFRRQATVQQAKFELTQQQLQLEQLRENVTLEFEKARGERVRALTSVTSQQRTVDQAQRVYDLTVLRFEQGLSTQLEVTDARLALLRARTNVAQAITDFRIADAQLKRATTN